MSTPCAQRILVLLLFPMALLEPPVAQAGPLGIAGEFNIFVFGNIEQWGTDIEGRVAAGGNAIYGKPNVVDANGAITEYNGFAVASTTTSPSLNLVAGNDVILTNGSVGYLEPGNTGSPISQKGDIVYGGSAAVGPSVGYGSLQSGNPINFANEQSYLAGLSASWSAMAANGTTSILKNAGTTYEIDLTGGNASLNVFSLDAADIAQDISFKFVAPETSTILVNVSGDAAVLMKVGFYFNGVAGEFDHATGYPYSNILFNFFEASDIDINQIAIDGSLLAPLAHIDFGEDSHIDGNLIAASLTGQGEAHARLFSGNVSLAVPEPAMPLLLAGGLAGMAIGRRRWRGSSRTSWE